MTIIARIGLGRYLPKRYNEGSTNRRNKPGIAFLDTDKTKVKGQYVEKWNWDETI